MNVKVMLVIVAVVFAAARSQEATVLPCAPWQAFDGSLEPTSALGEDERTWLIDDALFSVERLHVDPGFDGVDLVDLRQAYEPRIASVRYDHEVYALVQEMLAWVDGAVLSREERGRLIARASYTGVGVHVSSLSDGQVLAINRVYPGSPAEVAGLARGDRIIAVDRRTACPYPMDILGPAGTDVILTVASPGQSQREVTITRSVIEPIAAPRVLSLDDHGIVYLWPGNMSGSGPLMTASGQLEAIRAALDEVGAFDAPDALDGLVVDLRGAVGEDSLAFSAMRGFAGWFVDGALWNLVGRSGRSSVPSIAQPERLDGVSLVILVDASTGNMYAIFAAALQERGRALIVGEPVSVSWRSYRDERLWNDSVIVVPNSEVELLDGSRPRQSGFRPDSIMTVDWRDFSERDDPYVAEAIRLIRTAGIGTD